MPDVVTFYRTIVVPGLERLQQVGGPAPSARASVLLLAISGQEANWSARRQLHGPARGLWQFERSGGVIGVLAHARTRHVALALCDEAGVEPSSKHVHAALERDDLLACGFARLLLWTDPAPLPARQWPAWETYLSLWRPGKPHRDRWPDCYRAALAAVPIPAVPIPADA